MNVPSELTLTVAPAVELTRAAVSGEGPSLSVSFARTLPETKTEVVVACDAETSSCVLPIVS